MGKLKGFIIVSLMLLLGSNCFARQISFQIVQHDISADDVTEQSLSIEDEMLNGFFEKGYIVTNSPSVVSVSESQDEKFWNAGIGEAFEGFSDYFIQVKLFYVASDDKRNKNISQIDWTVAAAKTGVVIENGSTENKFNINKKDDLRKLSYNLVSEIAKVLKA